MSAFGMVKSAIPNALSCNRQILKIRLLFRHSEDDDGYHELWQRDYKSAQWLIKKNKNYGAMVLQH